MNRFQRALELTKTSFRVIGRNKELLIFPLVSFICTCMIVLFFLAPPLLRPTGHPYTSAAHWQAVRDSLFQQQTSTTTSPQTQNTQYGLTRAAVIYLGFLYFVSMFIATFCNVAFYHEILEALSGQPVSLGRGLKFALSRTGPIFVWTLFAGLVGMLIKAIEDRWSVFGSLLARLLGLAWSIAAVFAIPVLVREQPTANPITLLRKSAEVLKNAWGEALIGYVGLSAANFLIIGSLLWLAAATALSIASHQWWIIAVAVAAWILAVIVWSYVMGVAGHVFRAALYLYAAEGTVTEPYTQDHFNMAWKHKKS